MSSNALISKENEYKDEIFAYLTQKEANMLPDPNYMTKQPELQWSMRSKVVKWFIEIRNYYNLNNEIVYLSVNILDRFLSLKQVNADKLLLLAAVSLIIAAKYEYPHRRYLIRRIIKIQELEREKVHVAERFILQKLNYELD